MGFDFSQMFCENTPMARTPEEKREVAEAFRQQFVNKPGRKTLQRAGPPGDYNEVSQKPPRGKANSHLQKWDHLVRVSSAAQTGIAANLRRSRQIDDILDQIARQIENHSGQLAVPDANVWLRGIPSGVSRPDCVAVVEMIEAGQLAPCISSGIIAEVTSVGARMIAEGELAAAGYEELIKILAMAINVDLLPAVIKPVLPADQSDAKYLAVAAKTRRFSGGEQVPVVSLDGHLLRAPEEFLGEIQVMTPHAFLEWINNLK